MEILEDTNLNIHHHLMLLSVLPVTKYYSVTLTKCHSYTNKMSQLNQQNVTVLYSENVTVALTKCHSYTNKV